MEYIFNTVNLVHTKMADPEPDSKPKHAFARSDRSIVLTIYVTLIEHKIVNSQ